MTLHHLDLYGPAIATGTEKALLHARLKLSRDALVWKVEGLGDADVRRPMTDSATNLIGLVKHLTLLEGYYLCDAFGRPRPTLAWESDEDAKLGFPADFYAKPEERVEDLIADYHAAGTAADLTIEELELDTTGRHPAGVTVSLRWMLLQRHHRHRPAYWPRRHHSRTHRRLDRFAPANPWAHAAAQGHRAVAHVQRAGPRRDRHRDLAGVHPGTAVVQVTDLV